MKKFKWKGVLNLPNKISLVRILLIPCIVLFALLQNITVIKSGRIIRNGLWFSLPVFFLFVIAALTDFIDGNLARKRNEVTTLGKFLDTLADKLLVITVLILMVSLFDRVYSIKFTFNSDYRYLLNNSLNASFFSRLAKTEHNIKIFMIITLIIIVTREFLVTGLRQMAASKNIIMQADILGKIKTAATLITIGFNLLVPFASIRVENALLNNVTTEKLSKISNQGLIYEKFVCVLWAICLIFTIASAINYFAKNFKVLIDIPETVQKNKDKIKQKKEDIIIDAEIINDKKREKKEDITINAEIVNDIKREKN